jgi:hypothetical protein
MALKGLRRFSAGIPDLSVFVKGEFLALFFQGALFFANMNMDAGVIPFFVTNDIMGHDHSLMCSLN